MLNVAPLRKRIVVATMAFATLFLSSVETSYAQPSPAIEIDLASDELRAAVAPGEPELNLPTLVEMSDRSTVVATEMLLVSVMMERVELARTPDGAREIAKSVSKEKYGWSSKQFTCLDNLWTRESHWNYKARNPRTGAHGIAQALPATKMEVVGTDWRTNPITQIEWGLYYISVRYDTPCKAYSKFRRSGYY